MEQLIHISQGTGLNSDDTINMLPSGDSPSDPSVSNSGRLNVIIEHGDMLAVSNMYGNTLRSYSLPAGNNKVLGSVEDRENRALIYFIWNSNSNHCILRFNSNNTFTAISTNESTWNLQAAYPIKAVIIGSGDDKQLIWTDYYNEPRKIIIKNLIDGVYAALDIAKINLIKPAPSTAMLFDSRQSDATYFQNNIRDKFFQFSYRYVYDSGEKSVWSAYTNSAFSYAFSAVNSYWYNTLSFAGDITDQNYIVLNYYVDYDNVTQVEIAFRVCDIGSGAVGYWNLYDVVDVSSTGTKVYNFYNDKNYSVLPQDDFGRLYDDVPKLAKSVEVLLDNRVCLGGVKKDYDNVNLNITL